MGIIFYGVIIIIFNTIHSIIVVKTLNTTIMCDSVADSTDSYGSFFFFYSSRSPDNKADK